MNIQDNRPKTASALIDILPESALTRKRPTDTNRVFLKAMASRMEGVCLQMLEKGFPSSPAAPIIGTVSAEKFTFPSYFQLAVALELSELVKGMIKVLYINEKVDVNISWYQLSPIHLACLNGNEKILSLLLDNGANINQGLGLEDMYLLSKLKMSGNHFIPDENNNEIHPKIPKSHVNDSQKDIFRQAGYKGPILVGAEYTQNLMVYPFELAYVNGHSKLATTLLEQY